MRPFALYDKRFWIQITERAVREQHLLLEVVLVISVPSPQNTKELTLTNTVTLNIFTFCKPLENASAAFIQNHVHRVEDHTFNSVVK